MASPSSHETEVIRAPSRAAPRHPAYATVFLAGPTTVASSSATSPAAGDWRGALCARLAGRPLTVYDPRRADWGTGSEWREDAACALFAEQTAWELARAEAADLVVFYFGPATDAPVSLLELGLAVGRRYGPAGDDDDRGGGGGGGGNGAQAGSKHGRPRGTVVVCVDPAYRKRGNVQMVCQRYGVELVYDFDELIAAMMRSLESLRE